MTRGVGLARDRAKGAGVQVQAGIAELRAVEEIERFRAEVDAPGLGEGERLRQADVLAEARPRSQLRVEARRVAEPVAGLRGERILVEVFVHVRVELGARDRSAPSVVAGDHRTRGPVEDRERVVAGERER